MGCWGTGITQSDEYADVYERFMEEYDEGKPVSEITGDILQEYLDTFDAEDGVLHDVYFALGKAEWMCGGVSPEILERITRIVNNGENLQFFRELGTTEADIKLRKKNLERFWTGLMTPRGKVKKRKVSEEKYVPKEKPRQLPKVKCGDIFCYVHENKYRAFALTEKLRLYAYGTSVYCYAWREDFETIPTYEELLEAFILPLGWFNGTTFPEVEKLYYIGNYPSIIDLSMIYPRVIHKFWKRVENSLAKTEHLLKDYPEDLCMPLETALIKIEKLRRGEGVKDDE